MASFNVSSQKLVLDLAELFKGTNLNADLGGAVGCMSGTTDPECPAVFKALQIDLATGKSINGGASQTVFRAEAK